MSNPVTLPHITMLHTNIDARSRNERLRDEKREADRKARRTTDADQPVDLSLPDDLSDRGV
jgi:hypothetical protein